MDRVIRRLGTCVVSLLACSAPADRPAAAAADSSKAAKNPLALADVAGRWKVRAMNYRGESLTTYELTATGDTTGWAITFANRPPLPLQIIAVGGDSIVTETGPYPSILRTSVAVRSLRAVHRLEGRDLVGSFTAHYDTTQPDSVLHGTHVGSRMP